MSGQADVTRTGTAEAPSTLLEHLNAAEEGRLVLERMYTRLMYENSAQFIHHFVSTSDYKCRHERAGCVLCDEFDGVWKALASYRALVMGWLDEGKAAAERRAREQAEREAVERIAEETTAYLASRPEFEALPAVGVVS